MGLLDSLNDPNGALAQGMQSPLFSLGMGLIGGAQPFQNPAQQIQGARTAQLQQMGARQQYALNQQLNPLQVQQAQLQLQQQQYGLKMFQQSMPTVMRTLTALGLLAGSPAGQPQDSQASAAAAPSGGLLAAGQQPSGASAFPLGQAPGAGAAPTPQGAPPPGGGGIDPNQAERASLGMSLMAPFNPIAASVAPALGKYAEFQAQNNPALITQREAAKSAVSQDQAMIQQALASGNQAMAQAIYNGKLQKDLGLLQVSSMGGIQTRIDPRTGLISTLNPSTGIESQGNQASLMPGMTQALEQKAGAEARGQAQGKLTEVTGPDGTKYQVPLSILLGGAAQRSAGPAVPGSGIGAAPVAALGPAQSEMLKGNAEAALGVNKEYQDQAETGQQMVAQVQELKHAATDFSPGRFADTRKTFLDYLRAAGMASDDQLKALGSAQVGDKIAIQLQASATKQLGSREAAQIFQQMGKSLPNLTLSPDGLSKVSAWQEGVSRYQIARAQYANARAQSNDVAGVNNTRDTWVKQSNPLFYVVGSAPTETQKAMIASFKNPQAFLQQWQAAVKAGFAPRPGEYGGE